ncbi:MAG: type II toxin-antitoxin system VapC family toxin [Chloroflexota bacterium]|nr:type II toxin-antitoxin system VapC family toxin [Chloroflexota bacterium]
MLDTNALLWLRTGQSSLGDVCRHRIDEAFRKDELSVSAISFWEVALLQARGRIEFPEQVDSWRLELLGQGVKEIPVDGDVGIRAVLLRDFHADPADRIIVATAQAGHTLVTADRKILDWQGALRKLDARQ